MVLLKEKYVIIEYNAVVSCIACQWLGYSNFEQIKNGNEKALEFLKEKNLSKWLIDNRNAALLPKEARDWLHQEFVHKAIQGGLKKMAVILPESIFGKMSVNEIVTEIKDILFIQNFSEVEEALHWLRK